MSQLGERLRATREEHGISIEEAARATRISLPALRALEAGDYSALPNNVVAKGFIRNYAEYLGLSPDDMIQLYREDNGTTAPIRVVPATSQPSTRSFLLPSFFGVFFVTIALVGTAYFALNALGYVGNTDDIASNDSPAAASTPLPPTPTPLAATTREPAGAAPAATSTPFVLPSAFPPGVTPTAIPPTPTLAAPIVLNIQLRPETVEGVYMQVIADGLIVYDQVMLPTEQQTILAQETVRVLTGNPGDVLVGAQGAPPAPIGETTGEFSEWVYPEQPAPAPQP